MVLEHKVSAVIGDVKSPAATSFGFASLRGLAFPLLTGLAGMSQRPDGAKRAQAILNRRYDPKPVAKPEGRAAPGRREAGPGDFRSPLWPKAGLGLLLSCALRVGAIIAERYELLRNVETGSQGVIFEALDQVSGKRVAVKLLRTGILGSKGRKRALREVKILQNIHHPNIIRYLDAGHSEDELDFLVLEWLAGQDLAQAIQRRSFSLGEVLEIARQLSLALLCAHEAGIAHRDIKPANVFLLGSGSVSEDLNPKVKLLDFGVAKAMEGDTSLTTSGSILGTPCYMAPEQALSVQNIDSRSDIFSLAVVLYELLLGVLPWESSSDLVRLARMQSERARPARELAPSIPSELANFLSRSLELKPENRPQNMQIVLHCIEQIKLRVTPQGLKQVYSMPKSVLKQERTQSVSARDLSRKSRALSQTDDELATRPRRSSLLKDSAAPSFEATLSQFGFTTANAGAAEEKATVIGETDKAGASADGLGREASSRRLMQSLQAVLAGDRGRLFLIKASAGLGKTHLSRALWRSFRRQPYLVWQSRVQEWFQDRPYSLFREFLIRRCEILPSDSLAFVRRKLLHEFGAVAESQAEAEKPKQVLASVEADRDGTQVDITSTRGLDFDILSRFLWSGLHSNSVEFLVRKSDIQLLRQALLFLLQHLAQDQGLLIIIDDFHFLDQESQTVLAEVHDREMSVPVVVLGLVAKGFLDEPRFRFSEVDSVLAPMTHGDASAMIQNLQVRFRPAQIQALLTAAGGNPLFLTQLASHCSKHENDDDHRLFERLPATIGELIRIRIRRLSSTSADVLCAAAVVGDIFWAEALLSLIKVSKRALFEALLELKGEGFIEAHSRSRLRDCHEFTFSHGVFRSVVLAWYAQADRRHLHGRTVRFLRRFGGVDELYLAEHLCRSGQNEKAGLIYARCATHALAWESSALASALVERGFRAIEAEDFNNIARLALTHLASKLQP